jgi:hypothetical protein
MAKLKFIPTVLFFLISFSSDHHSQAQIKKTGTATVSGQVTLNNEPVRRVPVILQEKNNYQASPIRGKTDNDGRFYLKGISAGSYMISVVAPNYIVQSEWQGGRQGKTLNVSEGESVENIEIELVRGGVISGKVTNSNGGPIVETFVNIVPVDQQGKQISYNRQTPNLNYLTDDRGIYRIYGLPAGRYLVSVGRSSQPSMGSYAGSIYFPQTFHPDVTDQSKAALVDLSEGGEVSDVNITVGEMNKIYSVSGRVIDFDTGAPLNNVSIRYGPATNDQNISGGARSNNRGEFVLSGLLPGSYRVTAVPDNNNGFYSDPRTIEITEGDVAGVELKARRGGVISGIVIIESINDPKLLSKISILQLSAYSRTQDAVPSYISSRVNPDGTFRIIGVQPGKVGLSLYPSNQELQGITIDRIENAGVQLPREFDFAPGQQMEYLRVIASHNTGIVRGKVSVLGEPLPKGYFFRVMAMKKGAERTQYFNANAEVDARGQFIMERLPPGEYLLSLSISPYQSSIPLNRSTMPALNREIYAAVNRVKQQVSVTNNAAAQVTIELDLTRKEENR